MQMIKNAFLVTSDEGDTECKKLQTPLRNVKSFVLLMSIVFVLTIFVPIYAPLYFLIADFLLFLLSSLFCSCKIFILLFCYPLFFLVELVLLTSARKLPPQEETPNEAAARVLLLAAPTTQFLWGCEEP